MIVAGAGMPHDDLVKLCEKYIEPEMIKAKELESSPIRTSISEVVLSMVHHLECFTYFSFSIKEAHAGFPWTNPQITML